jgi:capsule polysaccharide export protein KpsE/RkpR
MRLQEVVKTAVLICTCVAAIGFGIITLQAHLNEKRKRDEVSRLRLELNRQRETVEKSARDVARFRLAEGIIDSDPGDSSASVYIGPAKDGYEMFHLNLRELKLRVAEFEAELERMKLEDPGVLRINKGVTSPNGVISPVDKALLSREHAKAEDATLESSGVGSSDPRRQALRAQIEASNKEIHQHNSALLDVQRRTLLKLSDDAKHFPKPSQHPKLLEYKSIKARYLSEREAVETGEKKYARAMAELDSNHGPSR